MKRGGPIGGRGIAGRTTATGGRIAIGGRIPTGGRIAGTGIRGAGETERRVVADPDGMLAVVSIWKPGVRMTMLRR